MLRFWYFSNYFKQISLEQHIQGKVPSTLTKLEPFAFFKKHKLQFSSLRTQFSDSYISLFHFIFIFITSYIIPKFYYYLPLFPYASFNSVEHIITCDTHYAYPYNSMILPIFRYTRKYIPSRIRLLTKFFSLCKILTQSKSTLWPSTLRWPYWSLIYV